MFGLGWYSFIVYVLLFVFFMFIIFRRDSVESKLLISLLCSFVLVTGMLFMFEVNSLYPSTEKQLHSEKYLVDKISMEDIVWLSDDIKSNGRSPRYEGSNKLGKEKVLNVNFLKVDKLNDALNHLEDYHIVTYKVSRAGWLGVVTPSTKINCLEQK